MCIRDSTKIPYYKAPNGMDNQAFFEKLCWDGLERRYGPDVPQSNKDRLTDVYKRQHSGCLCGSAHGWRA